MELSVRTLPSPTTPITFGWDGVRAGFARTLPMALQAAGAVAPGLARKTKNLLAAMLAGVAVVWMLRQFEGEDKGTGGSRPRHPPSIPCGYASAALTPADANEAISL